jgi:hypothetical protein
MSGQPARESADSTSASRGRGCESSGNARPMHSAEPSLPDIGPESHATPTFAAFMPHRTLQSDGSVEEGFAERDVIDALHLPTGNREPLVLSDFSAEGSPVKTSHRLGSEPGLQESDPSSSSTSPESPQLFSAPVVGSSLRTYPDSFPRAMAEISPSYSRRWANSGFTISPGECWIADTSECPSAGSVYSSLPDVLVAHHAPRFFLSPRAAAGIIGRAAKRGRALPPPLARALAVLASLLPGDDKRTTQTSSTPSIPTAGEPTTTPPKQGTLLDPSWPEQTSSETRRQVEGTSSPPISAPSEPNHTPLGLSNQSSIRSSQTPSPQRGTMPAKTEQEDRPSSAPCQPDLAERQGPRKPQEDRSLRRLTPTERERLQGFPDGWTIPYGPSLAPSTQPLMGLESDRWAMRSRSQSQSGLAGASSISSESE